MASYTHTTYASGSAIINGKRRSIHKRRSQLRLNFDSIKYLELGSWDSCMRFRMHAFPLPSSSISQKEYSPFECVSCDYGQMKSYSIRDYTGSIIYNDAATEMLWIYLVKSKSKWFSTLKKLIREYWPATNAKSAKLKVLKSDFC